MVQLNPPVDAPKIRAPKYSLLIAAPTIDDPTFRFGRFTFLPERCGDGGRRLLECGGNTSVMTLGNRTSGVDGESFLVYGGEACSTFGFGAFDFAGRAERQLSAIQSFQIAAELWTGSLGLASRSLVDPLADTLTAPETTATAVDALGCVEQGIATYGKGAQGMVHVTPQMLTHLVVNQLVYRDGGLWFTAMGNIVVADAGYDGTGPNGEPATSSQWIYGTSMIQVRLGAVDTIPGDLSQGIDRAVNDVEYWSYRPVAWEWDTCVHVAAQVNVAPCLVGGAS